MALCPCVPWLRRVARHDPPCTHCARRPQTVDDDLRAAFEKYGKVTDCFIPKDRETGKPKGFGFVTLTDKRDADDAVDALNGLVSRLCHARCPEFP